LKIGATEDTGTDTYPRHERLDRAGDAPIAGTLWGHMESLMAKSGMA